MELAALKLFDVDEERGTVMVRMGKGRKDRHVPAGARALGWLRRYVDESRPLLAVGSDDGSVFLNNAGARFELWQVTHIVGAYVRKAETGKTGSCHLFRHTVATLMLENGADVRMIQELLGHASLDTTQLYTRVSITLLKRVHEATHPGLGGRKAEPAERDRGAEAELFAALDEDGAAGDGL